MGLSEVDGAIGESLGAGAKEKKRVEEEKNEEEEKIKKKDKGKAPAHQSLGLNKTPSHASQDLEKDESTITTLSTLLNSDLNPLLLYMD